MDLSQVRTGIDRVDEQIRQLFIERMQLARQIAEIKAQTKDSIFKPEREKEIIIRYSADLEPDMVRGYSVFLKKMIQISREYQYGLTLDLYDSFPYKFIEEAPVIRKPVMLHNDQYVCSRFSQDQIITVDTYQEMEQMLREQKADAGICMMEDETGDLCRQIDDLLSRNHFYILYCDDYRDDSRRRRVVTFTDQPVVLAGHNRIRISFECADKSGSLENALSLIADYGVNLTEIDAQQIPNERRYRVRAECEANAGQKEIRAMLFQLSKEIQNFQLLGSFQSKGDLL